MTVPLLDLRAQYRAMSAELDEAVRSIVNDQAFIMGAPVKNLEATIAAYSGTSHGIACASGSDALLLSLKALDLQPGDEVITSPFTFFATAGAIVNAGGKPVFVDIETDTFNISPTLVAGALTDRTRAIVPVHLFGQMAPMGDLVDLAGGEVAIIEDAAQAIGAKQLVGGEWRRSGELGKTGCFSFFPSKNLGCWGDGGMIVTGDAALAGRLARLRNHGGAKQYHHDEVGFNSRLDAIQAAVLAVKHPYLDGWNIVRRENAAKYGDMLQEIDEVVCPATLENNEHVFHQYTIRARRRDGLLAHLKKNGIGCAVYYPKPLHVQPCFANLGYSAGQLPESERAAREVISLPIYPELTDEQQSSVVDTIREFYS